jgi:hypothetical protein
MIRDAVEDENGTSVELTEERANGAPLTHKLAERGHRTGYT